MDDDELSSTTIHGHVVVNETFLSYDDKYVICYTIVKRLTNRIFYGPGYLLLEYFLYIYGDTIMNRQGCDGLVFKPNKNDLRTIQNSLLEKFKDHTTVVNFLIY